MDRIVLPAAREPAHVRLTANVVNRGATDTGWITPERRDRIVATNPSGRVGTPADAANLAASCARPRAVG